MNFKYGDLVVKCHQCGGEEILEPLVTDGRALYLFNHDDSYLKLTCTKCDITMEMKIIPNEKANEELKDIIIEETNEELQGETVEAETV